MLNIKPVDNRVFIELDPMETKIGSVHLPDQHSERARVGTVKAVGSKVENVKVGDRILIFWSTGSRLHLIGSNLDEDRHRIVMDYEILAKLE